MSLLLDALKKAAEEKQKNQKEEPVFPTIQQEGNTTLEQASEPEKQEKKQTIPHFESFASSSSQQKEPLVKEEKTLVDTSPVQAEETSSDVEEEIDLALPESMSDQQEIEQFDLEQDNNEEESAEKQEAEADENGMGFVVHDFESDSDSNHKKAENNDQELFDNGYQFDTGSENSDEEEEEPFDFDALSQSLSSFDAEEQEKTEIADKPETAEKKLDNASENLPTEDANTESGAELKDEEDQNNSEILDEEIEYEDASSWDEERAIKAKKLFSSKDYLQKQESKKKFIHLFLFLLVTLVVAGGGFYLYSNEALLTQVLSSFSENDSSQLAYKPRQIRQTELTEKTHEKSFPDEGQAIQTSQLNKKTLAEKTPTSLKQQQEPKEKAAVKQEVTAPSLQSKESSVIKADAKKPADKIQTSQKEDSGSYKNKELPIKKLTFIKTSDNKNVHELLLKAYHQYNMGNFAEALNSYQQVYKIDAENKDALLGIAAISLAQGKKQNAKRIYQKLADLYPDDASIKSVFDSLSNQMEASDAEKITHIKELLRSNPDSPTLSFTLGNLLAEESRWAEAQQYYFQAYRLKPDNPDYIFNLAVSLDYLSQYKQAIKFYEMALNHAEDKVAGFNEKSVINRIDVLNAAIEANEGKQQ